MAKVIPFSEFHEIPVESRWFRVYDILPGIKAIYEPYHFQEVISYLIEGTDSAMLFDSGMGIGDMRYQVEHLTDKPVFLVNSHSHFDHTGSNWQFGTTHLLNIPKCVKLLETGFSRAEDDYNREAEAFWLEGKPWYDRKTFCVRPCKVIPIEEGHVFDLGTRKFTVLATPGHCPDALMLADDENKILFTGDTVYPAPLYAYIEGQSSVDIYQATMERLAEKYSDYTLICSHNAPIMEGKALAEIAQGFRDIRSGKLQPQPYHGCDCYPFDGFSIVI